MLKANDPCWCGSGRKFKRCHRDSAERLRPGRISPMRTVPEHIVRPDYAASGTPVRRAEPRVKSPDVIERMRRAGRAAAEVLEIGAAAVAPGVTTDEIDAIVHQAYIDRGGYPSTLNYRGYRKSLCTSVNEVICHGIPDDRPLKDGDIVNLDVTIYLDGVHGDTNATYLVGQVDPESRRLVEVTRQCLELGIAAVAPGRPFNEIGRAIETHAHAQGYEVVRAFVGHGIGEQFHTDLQIPHYFEPRLTTPMETGMVFTIEPMISMGTGQHRIWDDDWTAVTADGSRTAQFEHTVLVTDTGVEVLTAPVGVPANGRPPGPT
jgi:methionyl aminopeptidase